MTTGSTTTLRGEPSALGVTALTLCSPEAAAAAVGNFQKLKYLRHPHLQPYLDVIRPGSATSQHLLLVSEHHPTTLDSVLGSSPMQYESLRLVAWQVTAALSALHAAGIVHRGLHPGVISVEPSGSIRLTAYAEHLISAGGENVDWVIGKSNYMAPELVAAGPDSDRRHYGIHPSASTGSSLQHPSNTEPPSPASKAELEVVTKRRAAASSPKVDVWALGILMIRLAVGKAPWEELTSSPGLVFENLADFTGLAPPPIAKSPPSSIPGSGPPSPRSVASSRSRSSSVVNPFFTPPPVPPSSHGSLHPPPPPPSTSTTATPLSQSSSSSSSLAMATSKKSPSTYLSSWLQDKVPPELADFIACCLTVDPRERVDSEELLGHPFVAQSSLAQAAKHHWVQKPALRCLNISLPSIPQELMEPPRRLSSTPDLLKDSEDSFQASPAPIESHALSPSASIPTHVTSSNLSSVLSSLKATLRGLPEIKHPLTTAPTSTAAPKSFTTSLAELFHFWKMAGGDLTVELSRLGVIPSDPAILRIPLLIDVSNTPSSIASAAAASPSVPPSTYLIPVEVLRARLASKPGPSAGGHSGPVHRGALAATNPMATLARPRSDGSGVTIRSTPSAAERTGISGAPLTVREADVAYQSQRVALFRDLLEALPSVELELLEEAKVDIPPQVRGQVWATILGVTGDVHAIYSAIDKDSEGPIDRQIDLDIPRCHQYHPLLASPEGQSKLRRILKAWVAANPDLVYWQGLDSLAAPFLTLFFTNEAMAFCCLQELVIKYVHDFFAPDNTAFLQETLVIFRQVLAWHDPMLASHLHVEGFSPDLYAISWFLTLFAHSFNLDRIYHLWDSLLLAPPSLPWFFAVAVLRQQRHSLLTSSFDDMIGFFSGLPAVDVDASIRSAWSMFSSSPPSIAFRRSTTALDSAPDSRRWERSIPLVVLQAELTPRIDPADFLSLPTPRVVIDVRPPTEFAKCHHTEAINYPWNGSGAARGAGGNLGGSTAATGSNVAADLLANIASSKGAPVVIMGGADVDGAVEVANAFMLAGWPRVGVLHGGIDRLIREARSTLVQYVRKGAGSQVNSAPVDSPTKDRNTRRSSSPVSTMATTGSAGSRRSVFTTVSMASTKTNLTQARFGYKGQ